MQNTTTQWRRATQFFRKICTSHFIWKGCMWEEMETEQNCNILTLTLLAITAFLSRFPGLLNRKPGGPLSWVLVFLTASCHPGLVSKTGLVSNCSGLQTNWLPVFTELYNSSPSTFLLASQIALIQPIHGQGYNILIDRMHLLFTKVHLLFWHPGRVIGQYTTDLSIKIVMFLRTKVYRIQQNVSLNYLH